MTYKLIYHKKALKDKKKLIGDDLAGKVHKLCIKLSTDPFCLGSKQLYKDLSGKRSLRVNLKHRLIYEVNEEEKTVKIFSMWGHYSN